MRRHTKGDGLKFGAFIAFPCFSCFFTTFRIFVADLLLDAMRKIKETIRLRSRLLKNGCKSLYLDYYYKGNREYEYLNMYLVPENTPLDRTRNRETLKSAEAIKAKRIIEKQQIIAGTHKKESVSFYGLLDLVLAKKKKDVSSGTYFTHSNAANILRTFQSKDIPLAKIDRQWISSYNSYLIGQGYSNNYVVFHLRLIRSYLKFAEDNGFIDKSPAQTYKIQRKTDTKREYLTLEELKRLYNTDCRSAILKRVFLFSCLTGLRYSDIRKLTWGEVFEQDGLTRLVFSQKKTGGMEYLDINKQAAELLGERGADNSLVFADFRHGHFSPKLTKWAESAGIKKHLTFHSGRHTFAVIMLELGADLFTISKLLGHRDIKTTQIYAKILDRKKQDAVNRIPEL